jgi:hypothetical protein
MQQRRLRLGDILDDYCPRERRITNHAVVAMIEDQVKQTRCTTCDADHEYKQARVPARRKKDGSVLVMDAGAGSRRHAATGVADADDPVQDDLLPSDDFADGDADGDTTQLPEVSAALHAAAAAADNMAGDDDRDEPRGGDEDGPVHRRLIRATLPRPEGPSQEWKEPEFTVRQPGSGRGAGGGSFDGNRNGQRPGGHGPRRSGRPQGGVQGAQARFGAPRQDRGPRHNSGQPQGQGGNRPGRPGSGHGQGPGQGQSRGQRPGGGPGRKRGR